MRRNKLMTAVISSLRSVGINSPGGGDATLGDEARPTYQVLVSEEAAQEARRRFKDEAKAKKRVSVMSTSAEDAPGLFLGVSRRS
jgi:hypothetical protein